MFRLTNSNVLKTRLANQVVSNARNSLNHSIRFNSVAIERTTSTESTTSNSNGGNFNFSKTIKDVASSQIKENDSALAQRSRNRNNRKPYHSSPWFRQLSAFEDLVNQTTDFGASSQPFFWDDARKAMLLYNELRGTPDFQAYFVNKLAHLLHSGLRANRFQLTRLARKPDYDAKSFHAEMEDFVRDSVREILSDIMEGKVQVTATGAMHLITSLKELKLTQEAVGIWTAAMQTETNKIHFLDPKVVGALLPLMLESGSSFEDIDQLFKESNSITGNDLHQNLGLGMIKACLVANENTRALELFTELCGKHSRFTVPYLVEAHLSFIGECKDIAIATSFFNKAVNREMPYRLNLQVSAVKSFLTNLWNTEQDFDKVFDIWTQATTFYGRNIHHGISSSLNNTFFDIFFAKFKEDKDAGLLKLKEIIATYNNIKPIDEPFFNIIISKCGVWKDKSTVDSLYQAYSVYNIKKGQVSRRIYLKTLGSVEVTEEEILESWYDLLKFADYEQMHYIANADWAAIRDATVSSKTNQRPLLYAQIFKKYSPYCRDFGQYKKLKTHGLQGEITSKIFQSLENIDDGNVKTPSFTYIQKKLTFE